MPTLISGSTGIDKVQDSSITSAKIADGAITNTDINSSAAIVGSKLVMPTGSVLQVQSFYYGTSFTNSSNATTAATGLKKAITPSATSSKILVLVNICGIKKDAATSWLQFDLKCGSHETKRIERHYGYYGWVSEQTAMGPVGFTYLSSPSTTSSIEYEVYMGVWDGSGTSEMNLWGNSASSITLLEIAG